MQVSLFVMELFLVLKKKCFTENQDSLTLLLLCNLEPMNLTLTLSLNLPLNLPLNFLHLAMMTFWPQQIVKSSKTKAKRVFLSGKIIFLFWCPKMKKTRSKAKIIADIIVAQTRFLWGREAVSGVPKYLFLGHLIKYDADIFAVFANIDSKLGV